MGTYLFERNTGDGTGRDATASLAADVASALRQIDWVETFALREEDVDEDLVVVDVVFDEDWPDLRASYPDQVATMLGRYGLRLLANPQLTGRASESDDPLAPVAAATSAEDDESIDLFQFDE